MHNTLDNVALRCQPHNPREADCKRLAAKSERELVTRAELRETVEKVGETPLSGLGQLGLGTGEKTRRNSV